MKPKEEMTIREAPPHYSIKDLFVNINNQLKKTPLYYLLITITLLIFSYVLSKSIDVFNTTFIEDDLSIIERAGMIRENPWSFFTLTVSGFYRPIGYNLPSLLFIIVGFNLLFFHIFNLGIHLLTGVLVFLFARKLFDTVTGILASTLFISFPVFVIAVGFTSSLFQDEFSTLFFVLAFILFLREKPELQRNKPYLTPAILLLIGALCKDTWLGLLPALIMLDWLNYPNAAFRERFKRWWVLIIPFVTVILKFVLSDINIIQQSTRNYIAWNFNLNNTLYGLSLPFIPFEIFDPNSSLNLFRFVIPVIFIGIPVCLIKEQRRKVMLLSVAFIGSVLIQLTAPMNNFLFGWAHIFPLLVFSSILIASTLRYIGKKLKDRLLFWIPASICVLFLISASYPTTKMLLDFIKNASTGYAGWIRDLKVLVRRFPADANIYSFSGPSYYIAREIVISPKMEYHNVAVGKKKDINMKGFVFGNAEDVKTVLKPIANQPNFRAISYKYGKWEDLTVVIQDWLSKKDEPFPDSMVHEH